MVVMPHPTVKHWLRRIGGALALLVVLLVGLTPLVFVFRPVQPEYRQIKPKIDLNLEHPKQSAVVELRLLTAQPDYLFLPLVSEREDFVVTQARISVWQRNYLEPHLVKADQVKQHMGEVNPFWVMGQTYGLGWAYACVNPQQMAHIKAIEAEVERMLVDFYENNAQAQTTIKDARKQVEELLSKSSCLLLGV